MSGVLFTKDSTKRLKVGLAAPVTIGAGAVSLGCWMRIHAWYVGGGDWNDAFSLTETDASPNLGPAIFVGTSSTKLFLTGGSAGNLQTNFGELETNYWLAITRDAGTTMRLRIFTEDGTQVYTDTIAATNDWTTLDWIQFGNNGWGNPSANCTYWNYKLQTGVEWSQPEAWAEAQTFLIQKSGGTDRHAFRLSTLDDSTAGKHSCTSSLLLVDTNSNLTVGTGRPSVLEYDPLASDDFNRANETPLASPWATVPGGWSGQVNLSSNLAQGNGTDAPQYYDGGISWPDDQWCEVVVPDVSGDYDCSCVLRSGSGTGTVWSFWIGGAGGSVDQMGTGAFGSNIATRDPTLALGNGDYVMRLEAQGTTWKCYKNGVQVGGDVTSGYATTGKPGFFSYDSAGPFTAWTGGRFGTPPTGPEPTGMPRHVRSASWRWE